MKKYFYNDGTKEHGPFTFEELQNENITRETKVWFQELGEWKVAAEVPELSELFKLVPPPINEANSSKATAVPTDQKPPKNWLVESILVTLFCCLPFGIVGIINASSVESKFYAGDFVGAKQASRDARKWMLWGFWSGMIGILLYVVFYFFIFGVALLDEF